MSIETFNYLRFLVCVCKCVCVCVCVCVFVCVCMSCVHVLSVCVCVCVCLGVYYLCCVYLCAWQKHDMIRAAFETSHLKP